MFTTRREQLGDAFLDSLGITDASGDSIATPPTIQTTPFGTFDIPPGYVGGGSTVFNLPVGTSAIPVPASGPTTLQSLASATSGLTSIFNSIGSLFGSKPAPAATMPYNVTAPAAAAKPAISLTTILLIGGAAVVALAYTSKRRRARRA